MYYHPENGLMSLFHNLILQAMYLLNELQKWREYAQYSKLS